MAAGMEHGEIYAKDMILRYASFSDCGSRPVNEDAIKVIKGKQVSGFFLCDGLGGHGLGDIASQCVVQTCSEITENAEELKNLLKHCFDEAQARLMKKQQELKAEQKMKTTAVGLATDYRSVQAGHVGDSRLYCFKKGELKKQTLDHSIPQMLVVSREISKEEIRNHPDRNRLLRVMGIPWDEPRYELQKPVKWTKYDAFLLCSDGFWELITEDQMEECLQRSSDPVSWLSRMKAIVEKNGEEKSMDNYSAITISVGKAKKGKQ